MEEVQFALVEVLHVTKAVYPYMVQVSNEGGVIMTDAYSFNIVCGYATLTSQPAFKPEISFVIDGNVPSVVVPKWESKSPDDCRITRYEIYSDAETLSEAFDQDYEDLDEDHAVRFRLREDLALVKDDYTYYVKAHIEGGELVSGELKFRVVCGSETLTSVALIPSQSFVIDGEAKFLDIPYFETKSEDCPITTYEIYSDPDTISADFE